MQLIEFLERSKTAALILVIQSCVIFAYLALMMVMFCDTESFAPTCKRYFVLFVAIPILQFMSYSKAMKFLKERRNLRAAAALMILSVLPLPGLIIWFFL